MGTSQTQRRIPPLFYSLNQGSSVLSKMAEMAKGYQVLLFIVARVASKLNVMYLKTLHGSA